MSRFEIRGLWVWVGVVPPITTALGALVAHSSQGPKKVFQPMNINFGLFPPLEGKVPCRLRGKAYAERALTDLKTWMVEEGLAGSGQELPSCFGDRARNGPESGCGVFPPST